MAEKKYLRVGMIPLKCPVDHNDYMKIRRASDPLAKALELELADVKKIRELSKKFRI